MEVYDTIIGIDLKGILLGIAMPILFGLAIILFGKLLGSLTGNPAERIYRRVIYTVALFFLGAVIAWIIICLTNNTFHFMW